MNKITNLMEKTLIGLKCRAHCFIETLKDDESGVSPIIATVLTILIAVLLAAIFWDKIKLWIDTTWSDILKADDSIKK